MQEQQTGTTDIATLPPAERAVIALGSGKAETQLRELVEKSAVITTVIDLAGRDEAHRAGMNLKNARVAIEKTGKSAREDAQAFSKAVIAEEKRLIGIIANEEDRVFGLRDGYDARVRFEKEEADRKERERVDAIKRKIAAIEALQLSMHGETSAAIQIEIDALQAFVPGDEFDELKQQALAAAVATGNALIALRDRVKAQEDEAARIAAERAELERQQAEAAERERQARELREAEEARARAAREAEEKRLADERAAFEAERRAFQEQQAAAAKAEADRLEAEAVKEVVAPHQLDEVTGMLERGETVLVDPAGIEAPVAMPNKVITCGAEIPQVHTAPDALRQYATYTAEQFDGLASKVEAVGFRGFADQLRAVAGELRQGTHDHAIATADAGELIQSDEAVFAASEQCWLLSQRLA